MSKVTVLSFKMPVKSKHFNRNQKVWVQQELGNLAAKIVGKYRGRHRYVSAWVNFELTNPLKLRGLKLTRNLLSDTQFIF